MATEMTEVQDGTPTKTTTAAPKKQGGTTTVSSKPKARAKPSPQSQSRAKPKVESKRRLRWGYGYFAVAMSFYHFWWTALWLYFLLYDELFPELWALVFFCGLIPSVIVFSWLAVDSTVACCNQPFNSPINNICGCECMHRSKVVMVYPLGLACVLRVFMSVAIFGYSLHHDLTSNIDDAFITDNVFFWLVSWATWDCGPIILLTVDWWYYYGKKDLNGLFGSHLNPMRCVMGQNVHLAFASWAFVAWYEHYGDDAFEFYLPWILHGIVSTFVVLYCAAMQCQGIVEGNRISKPVYGYIATALAVIMGLLVICVFFFVIDLEMHGEGFEFFVFFYYYTATCVPSIIALASFKRQQGAVEWLDKIPEEKAQQKV